MALSDRPDSLLITKNPPSLVPSAASYPARVFKGMRMAGQMGASKVKVQNLRVLKVIPEDNVLVVKGSVPGHNKSYVIIQK